MKEKADKEFERVQNMTPEEKRAWITKKLKSRNGYKSLGNPKLEP